jgi:hypothetical protein
MTEPVKERKQHKRLTPKEWAKAETLWESGEVTQAALARKFDITEQAIHLHMKRHGKKHGAKAEENKRKVAEKVTAGLYEDAAVTAARIRETKDQHYQMASGIAKLAWSEVLKAKQDGAPMSSVGPNLKALDSAMTVLSKARAERWAVLGLDRPDHVDEDGIPELMISELSQEQVDQLRNREFDEFDEALAGAGDDGLGDSDDDEDEDADGEKD